MDTQTLKREAVRRVQGRRRPPEFRSYPGPDGSVLKMQIDTGSEFLPASTVAEWCDDTIARMAPGAVGEALIQIAEACRDGGLAAVVAGLDRLPEWDQYGVWVILQRWEESAPVFVSPLLATVRAEWRRHRRLATGKPSTPHRAETRAYISTEHGDLVNTGRRH